MPAKHRAIIPASDASQAVPCLLTREHRRYDAAITTAKSKLDDIRKLLSLEIKQLINGLNIDVDITLCQGSGLDVWLREADRLMLRSDLALSQGGAAYLAMDFIATHHLADLCLGGSTTQFEQDATIALSGTEIRVAGRVLHRAAKTLEYYLTKEKTAMPAVALKTPVIPEPVEFVTFKVRLVLEQDVLSWFMWLPVTLFVGPGPQQPEVSDTPIMQQHQWQQIRVRGRVEMARTRASLHQLKNFLNGELLPVELLQAVPFKLAQLDIFNGQIAEENGALAFQITQQREHCHER